MTTKPYMLSAGDALAAMATGALTSVDLVRSCLARVEARDTTVKAWAHVDPELALAAAEKADARRANGVPGELNGLPVGIKDIIDTDDLPTEHGSRASVGRRPLNNAFLVKRLREAGAVILGKTVTTEFAMSAPAATVNPHNTSHTPGGSSSGSAAAVADYHVPVAIGTQTGGSVIRPSSFCGVYGLKPTFGTVSRTGLSLLSRRLDTPGIHARDLDDLGLVASVIMANDPLDLDMRADVVFDAAEPLERDPVIAFVRGPAWPSGEADMRLAIEDLVVSLTPLIDDRELPPIMEDAVFCHQVIMDATAAANLGDVVERAPDLLDPITLSRVERGMPVTAVEYIDALAQAEEMQQALAGFFDGYDALITPAAPGQAPASLATTGNAVFNGYWTLLGVPSITVPVLTGDRGMPMGVQVIGPWGEEGRLLEIARWLVDKVGTWPGLEQIHAA